MSRDTRKNLIEGIGRLVMRWQDATRAFDEAVGERLGLASAEMQCLGFLYAGPQTAGAIARAVGLTPAAVTSLIDRLETRKLVERVKNLEDRRQTHVALTAAALKATARYYAPIAKEGAALLATKSTAELESLKAFFTDALALQQRHIEKIHEKKGQRHA
jgi:DNA-binding MarR family transcriptional regulator